MSSYKYKKTKDEDENPLTLHAESSIEMSNLASAQTSVPNSPSKSETGTVTTKNVKKSKCQIKICYLVWAILSTITLFGVIIAAVIGHGSMRKIKWCCQTPEELYKCQEMAAYFDFKTLRPRVICKLVTSMQECVDLIDTDEADTMTMSSRELFQYRNLLKPIMAEEVYSYNSTEAAYGEYFVRAEHVGISNKPGIQCNVSSYCVDQMTARHSPFIVEHSLDHLLTSVGRCPLTTLETVDLQSGFKECPLVFTSINSLNHSIRSGKLNESDVRIVCLNGSTTSFSNYLQCTELFSPTRTIVISNKLREGTDADIPSLVVELFHVAYLYFGRFTTEDFSLFSSRNGTDVLFSDRSLKLVPLTPNCTASAYLGDSYLKFLGAKTEETMSLGNCFLNEFKRPTVHR